MLKFIKFNLLAALLLLFFSCTNYEVTPIEVDDCIKVYQETNWIKEPFNSDYTIMFPEMYTSHSQYFPPTSKFEIRRDDEKVVLEGGFCDPLAIPCLVWDFQGNSIDTKLDSIGPSPMNDSYLNNKKTFCQDNFEIAYFYYKVSMTNNFRNAYGQLFLIDKSDSSFKLAGNISFAISEKQEVFDILRTLHFE